MGKAVVLLIAEMEDILRETQNDTKALLRGNTPDKPTVPKWTVDISKNYAVESVLKQLLERAKKILGEKKERESQP